MESALIPLEKMVSVKFLGSFVFVYVSYSAKSDNTLGFSHLEVLLNHSA